MATAAGIRAGKAFIEVGLQPDMQRGMQLAQKQLKSFGARLGAASVAIGQLIAQGIQNALRALVDELGRAAKMARELEVESKLIDIRFREMAGSAREVIDNLELVGRTDAARALSQIQSQLENVGLSAGDARDGALSLVQGLDALVATTGRDATDVVMRLMSGLRGETEAIEDLGINLKVANLAQTEFAKRHKLSANRMSEAQKAAASLEIIFERLNKATREQTELGETYNSSLARLRRAWDDMLLAILRQVDQETVTDFLNELTTQIGELQRIIEDFDASNLTQALNAITIAIDGVLWRLEQVNLALDALSGRDKESGIEALFRPLLPAGIPEVLSFYERWLGRQERERGKELDKRIKALQDRLRRRGPLDLGGLGGATQRAARFVTAPTDVQAGTKRAFDEVERVRQQFEQQMFDREIELAMAQKDLLAQIAENTRNQGNVRAE